VELRRYSTCPQSNTCERAEYSARVAEVAGWSEEAGFYGMLVYTDNGLVDPWLVAQQVVQCTECLVPLVAVQPAYMHPYTVAKMVATIALLHGRKLELNLLAGGFRNDLLALGDETPHDDRYARTVEYGEVIVRFLDGGAVTYEGQYYRVRNLKLQPPIPPELRPGIVVSGSSPSGLDAARRLGATAIRYPPPPGEDPAELEEGLEHGVRIGVIARPTDDEAWAVAHARFPDDRKGQIAHELAMRVSDSHWHRQLSEREDAGGGGRSPYWLGPFRNYQTFCPYVVGSYDRVAEMIATYTAHGSVAFILDIPPSEAELEHTRVAFARAQPSAAR
jgi:alkanesulfonate monooxygenase